MVGIYKITSPKNRVYIGQSVNIEKRLRRYVVMSVKTKGQTKVWRSLVKYGPENHKYEIIEECEIGELNIRERFWQEHYDSVENGLNCRYTKTNDKSGKLSKETLKRMSESQKGNQNWLGKKHSDETKEKIRKKAIGRKHSDEVNKRKGRKGTIPPLKGLFGKDNPLSKKVAQYNLNGELVMVWHSLMDIRRELGYHIGNVSSCCNGKLKRYKGFIWKHV
jgi:group I intron endonuclease